MTNNYSIDQQILNWRYQTISRYQLSEIPITVTKGFLDQPSSNATNFFTKFAFNNFNKKKRKSGGSLKFKTLSCLLLNFFLQGHKPKGGQSHNTIAKVYFNHAQLWGSLEKITLHTTSGKLLSNIELYASFYIAFCCCGTQSPQIIRSKQAVAGFNVIKTAIIGTGSCLRNKNLVYFSYKWAYLVPELPYLRFSGKLLLKEKKAQPSQYCLGIQNVFIFPELDKYDYYLFEPMTGFDLSFYYKEY